VQFEHPFNVEALTELRWYLEEYLRFPYGLEPEKAKQTEQKFQIWGQQLFELVFPRTTKAWDFFQEATREGLDQCELNVSSDDPTVLNLPWELLYCPDYQFLAPSLAGVYRSLNGYAVRAELPELPQDKLNILLVIARPYGEKDVSLKTIARPLIEALRPIWNRVNLKVLRPPSFEQFEQELNQHKGFYHIVHFDGHGDFDPKSQGLQHSLGRQGQGVLVFESQDGSPQIITAAQIAQSLTDCRVPMFMLNACKSAQEGEESFSSVATRLVALGAKGVVAMAYSVYAEAAKQFMGRAYRQLVLGDSLSMAVAAGRRAALNQRQRPSPKGDLPLQDWIVPVLYQQEAYSPFKPFGQNSLDIESFLEQPAAESLVGFPDEGVYGFVGRDYDILRLERAFRQNHVVLLQGMGGVGKTQLACGLAQWMSETQGRSLCFFRSFEHGASLINVVNQVGRAIWGEKFSQYPWEQQQQAVMNYLKAQPCLLVWDNFEPVAGFPTGNEPLLMDAEREDLKQFLKDLRGGQSWVLITSRREEPWLDCGYTLQNLQGLSQADTEEFAAKVLRSAGVDRATLPPEYLELMKLLGGNPLALRVVLPRLKTETPLQLIEALRQGLDKFKGNSEEGRDKSLTVSLDYSFTKLSNHAQRHLPFLGLFSEMVFIKYLARFSNSTDEAGCAYQEVFREQLQESEWLQILDEAASVGIVEDFLSGVFFKIHPILPGYLYQKLTETTSRQSIQKLERELLFLYARSANFRSEELGSSPSAISALLIEEPNFLRYLNFAEHEQDWDSAVSILQTLGEAFQRLGRQSEFKALRQKALNQVGVYPSVAKVKGKAAFEFWRFVRHADAIEAVESGNLAIAKQINQEILDELTDLNDSSVIEFMAGLYIELGNIALQERNFDTAIMHFQNAQKVYEKLKDKQNLAGIYHNLGVAFQEKGDLDTASNYHQQALQIHEEKGDSYHASSEYFELGIIAFQQNDFDLAISQFNKALKIREDLGDWERAANIYYYLGMVARNQNDSVVAKQNLRKALKIQEDSNNLPRLAGTYQELGSVAYVEENFDDAIAYYQKALQVYECLDYPHETANTYHNLGQALKKQHRHDDAAKSYRAAADFFHRYRNWEWFAKSLRFLGDALEWQEDFAGALEAYLQAVSIDIEHRQSIYRSDLENLGWMLLYLGEQEFRAVWQELMNHEASEDVYQDIQKTVVLTEDSISSPSIIYEFETKTMKIDPEQSVEQMALSLLRPLRYVKLREESLNIEDLLE
jgi:tetratricopeptide (TPR) repeat protein